MRIIIDGYNFIADVPHLRALFNRELKQARDELRDMLARYKKSRGHDITVVYDGPGGQWGREEASRVGGIKEVFTAEGEIADTVIIRKARENPDNLVVVTKDRAVELECAKAGAAVISPIEFEEKIMESLYSDAKGGQPEEKENQPFRGTQKKGPSKRLKRNQKLKLKRKAKL